MKILWGKDNTEYDFSYQSGDKIGVLMWDQHGSKKYERLGINEMLSEIVQELKTGNTKIISIDSIEMYDLIKSIFTSLSV